MTINPLPAAVTIANLTSQSCHDLSRLEEAQVPPGLRELVTTAKAVCGHPSQGVQVAASILHSVCGDVEAAMLLLHSKNKAENATLKQWKAAEDDLIGMWHHKYGRGAAVMLKTLWHYLDETLPAHSNDALTPGMCLLLGSRGLGPTTKRLRFLHHDNTSPYRAEWCIFDAASRGDLEWFFDFARMLSAQTCSAGDIHAPPGRFGVDEGLLMVMERPQACAKTGFPDPDCSANAPTASLKRKRECASPTLTRSSHDGIGAGQQGKRVRKKCGRRGQQSTAPATLYVGRCHCCDEQGLLHKVQGEGGTALLWCCLCKEFGTLRHV